MSGGDDDSCMKNQIAERAQEVPSEADQARNRRRRAEEKFQSAAAHEAEPAVSDRLVHELRVHQIELEMQNEELHRAADALTASRAHFVDLYDLAPAGYVTMNEAGLILEANLTVATLLGVSRSNLVRHKLAGFVVPDDLNTFTRQSRQLFETGRPQVCELHLLRENAQPFWARLESTRNEDSAEPACCVAISDVTEGTHDQELLHSQAVHLETLVRERTAELRVAVADLLHFSYTITHDMRAPLRAMQGFGELLLAEEPGLSSGGQVFVRRITEAAARLDRLITDALYYAKLSGSGMDVTAVDVGALLRGMIESYPNYEASKVDISIAPDLPSVLANEAGLTQCFSNLMNNAIRFVRPGLKPRVHIWAEDCGAQARIWVEDNGIGIDQEHQEKIFGMFQKLNSGTEGTGIGLALVRKAAQQMGGSVGVKSRPNEGARFWVQFGKVKDG